MNGRALISSVLFEDQVTSVSGGWAGSVPWWSFSKTVLASASLVLVRDGLLQLDEPVPGHPFTLRQLLRHQAGLTDYGAVPAYHAAVASDEEPWSEEDMLARAEASTLRYKPGEGWGYSNIGYLYVRRLIEKATQKNLDLALYSLVLKPLRISRTRLVANREQLIEIDMGETKSYDPRWVYHGLLAGPLQDATLFLHRLMTGDLLPAALLEAMQQSYAVGHSAPNRPWINPSYGLGLMIGTAAGQVLSGHTGAGPGSVIAVYHRHGATPRTSAAFAHLKEQAVVENEVVRTLCGVKFSDAY